MMDVEQFNVLLVEATMEATKGALPNEDIFFALAFGAIVVLETTVGKKNFTKEFFLEMAASVYDKREASLQPNGAVN